MKISEIKSAMPYLIKNNVTALLIGHHGLGKSQTLASIAKDNGFDRFVDLRLGSSSDSSDMVGLQDFVKNASGDNVGSKFLQPDWFPQPGEKVFILLDEVNQANPLVQPLIFQMALDYRLGPYQMDKNLVYIAAAVNPDTSDYSGNHSILDNKALRSRFCQIKFTPTWEEFLEYGRSSGFDSTLLGFMSENESLLEKTGVEDFSIVASPDRRAIDRANSLITSGLPQNLWVDVIGGMLGLETTLKLVEYAKNNKHAPLTADEVLNNYGTEKVQNKIKLYLETNRQDLITSTRDDLREHVKKMKKMTKKQADNLRKFCLDIPRGVAYSFFDSLLTEIEDIQSMRPVVKVILEHTMNEEYMDHFSEFDRQMEEAKASEGKRTA